jgi:hypothetical protein
MKLNPSLPKACAQAAGRSAQDKIPKDPCSSARSAVAFAQIFSVLPVFSVVKSVFAQFRSVSIRVNPRPLLVLTGDWQLLSSHFGNFSGY